MTLRNFELDRTVTVRELVRVLESHSRTEEGSHFVDLGEAGDYEVPCENAINVERIINELL